MQTIIEKQTSLKGITRSLGLVFGDIGTSHIYTLTVVFIILSSSRENIVGVVSLVIWALVALVARRFTRIWGISAASPSGRHGRASLSRSS